MKVYRLHIFCNKVLCVLFKEALTELHYGAGWLLYSATFQKVYRLPLSHATVLTYSTEGVKKRNKVGYLYHILATLLLIFEVYNGLISQSLCIVCTINISYCIMVFNMINV